MLNNIANVYKRDKGTNVKIKIQENLFDKSLSDWRYKRRCLSHFDSCPVEKSYSNNESYPNSREVNVYNNNKNLPKICIQRRGSNEYFRHQSTKFLFFYYQWRLQI